MKRSELLLLAAGLAATAAGWTFAGTPRSGVVHELERARPVRVFSPRLSISTEYRPCTVLRAKLGETVPRDACGAAGEPPAIVDALDDAGGSADPDSLHAAGLLPLLGFDATERSLDAAITRLSTALRLSRQRVPLLVDLSGAHLVRAGRDQNPLDLLAGLNYALKAVAAEPRNPAAQFNAALAMQMLGLDDQAVIAWTEYLRIDSTSTYAAEARERRRLLHHPVIARAPEPGAPEAEVRAYATQNPQEARLLGMDSVLGQWGRAVEAGDTAQAAKLLQLAEDLGIALRDRGGDLSLMDAVGAIRAAADDPVATQVLARAHRGYAEAQRLYQEHDTRDAARDSFAQVLIARPPSPTLVRSAEAFHIATRVYDGERAGPDAAYAALLTRIDSVRHPALAARVRWMRGTVLLRRTRYVDARASYRSAARLFERAGETEYAAYVHAQDGEAAYYQGDTAAAYPAMHRGLTALREYRSSRWLHNTLLVLGNSADTDAMPLAAEKIRGEDVFVSRRLPSSSVRAEALVGLVTMRAATDRRQAAEDLDSAAAVVVRMRETEARQDLEATVRFLGVLVATDSAAIARLDSAVEYFTRKNVNERVVPALLLRAKLRLARGQLPAATADLDSATARIHTLSHSESDASLRLAMMERARNHFDRLVMLHLHAADTVAALQALERGRVSFAPGSSRTAPAPHGLAAPPGEVAVEYALIGDTLLTWTIRGSNVRLHSETLDRGGFLRLIDRVGAALESPARARTPSARADLERLYEQLIQPVKDRLGASETIVILADGEVAGVPFSTLVDARSGRYLMEDHVLRFAPTLADAARAAPAAEGPARPALLVANPAFDPLQYLSLNDLDNTRVEVDSLARMYPGSKRLHGAQATRDSLILYAPRYSLIHYAGHALFDDTRPERSALVLAGDTTQKLTAEAVNHLQLRGVRLVVLAACRTLRSREGRSGGFSGFSGALLGAGVGGVVGSLWQVDDSLTTPFMLAFHYAYRQTGDPAAALREAQLEMLHSHDSKLNSPAVWGSFRYIGH